MITYHYKVEYEGGDTLWVYAPSLVAALTLFIVTYPTLEPVSIEKRPDTKSVYLTGTKGNYEIEVINVP